MRRVLLAIVTIAFAAAVHTDWHVARPATHHLSLGWGWHWLLAVPVGALTAWYVARNWPGQRLGASLVILGAGALLGGILEPGYEYWLEHASRDWAFGAIRNLAFATFTATAVVSHALALAIFNWTARGGAPA